MSVDFYCSPCQAYKPEDCRHEFTDEEHEALTACLFALRTLDADTSARVAHYLADRFPYIGEPA